MELCCPMIAEFRLHHAIHIHAINPRVRNSRASNRCALRNRAHVRNKYIMFSASFKLRPIYSLQMSTQTVTRGTEASFGSHGIVADETFLPLEGVCKISSIVKNVCATSRRPVAAGAIASQTKETLAYSFVASDAIIPQTREDPFKELHHIVEKEKEMGVSLGRTNFKKNEVSLVMEKLKESRSKGMEMIISKRKSNGTNGRSLLRDFFNTVEPKSLVPGEYVVHKTKGVGRFVRLQTEGESGPEYVILQYADGMAKLKAEQASRLLYRYYVTGEKGKAPVLSKLSDPLQWEKKKNKGKIVAQRMVVDLLQLYISRIRHKRPPYPKNSEWMNEFAAKFPYKATPDQEQAFVDVEKDMVERETPMDRLICGDVGFGKTEVALRAIFRAFCARKQVMILAPTTVLARQHYNVVTERFTSYNARIALLSRFQTQAEKRNLIMEIKAGTLDIIIGTHALLGSKIHYNNLGLLVVDEEQRFGVKQKERIASMKTSVDVLTLSATPIPRTLYLALVGFRDASLIATPPPERVPIKTHIMEYNEEKVKSAIKFELARNGQIYYVVPRSQGIQSKKAALQNLFPDITISVAHGKQSASLLEETMNSFAQGESQLLLCTSIIESGLDVRRVNTIIVEDVHFFGLAQVYQLRGRVGRADKEAHAYLFYPQKNVLSDESLEKLVALEEFCELGRGFNLAERDLAIRGFGSIFGEKQSGEAAHIGMDLFFDILFETLSKADHHVFFQLDYTEVKLDLQLHHGSVSDYIQNPITYEAVVSDLETAASSGLSELMYVTSNLRCDFGRESPSFESIMKSIYIRRIAADLGIDRIGVRAKTIFMESKMSETVFDILREGMTSDSLQSSLTFNEGLIELLLLADLPPSRLIDRIFACLVELRKGLSHFARQR